MYGKAATYYDEIYRWKNYEKETERLHKFIRVYKKSIGNTLLDVACGTGNHLVYLNKLYDVEGLDINPIQIAQARKKLPQVRFYKRDMRSFDLGKKFDVVTCLFSAIGYAKTRNGLRLAVGRMSHHLKPGGVLLLEPWFTPDQWHVGHLHVNFVDQPELKLARMSISKRRGRRSVNDEHHLVACSTGVEYFVERLEMGLFTDQEYREAFKRAALAVCHNAKGLMGRGLYIGLKPA